MADTALRVVSQALKWCVWTGLRPSGISTANQWGVPPSPDPIGGMKSKMKTSENSIHTNSTFASTREHLNGNAPANITAGDVLKADGTAKAKSTNIPGKSRPAATTSPAAPQGKATKENPGPKNEHAPKQTAVETLTLEEQANFVKYEKTIAEGLGHFAQTGLALKHIRNERLYKATHTTFEKYVQDRWQMGRQHAYRLINAAGFFSLVEDESKTACDMVMPESESQIRPLLALDEGQRLAAWKQAMEKAAGEPITAATVQEVVEEMVPSGDKPTKAKQTTKSDLAKKISALVSETLKVAADLDHDSLVKALETIHALINGKPQASE